MLQALILGIVQGATEFLPISSSGHLVLVPWLLGWEDPGLAFDAFLHLGTLVAVLAYFRDDLWSLTLAWVGSVRERSLDNPQARIAWLILWGTLPAAVMGLTLESLFERLFAAPVWVSIFLLVTGLLLFLGEGVRKSESQIESLTWLDALLVGLAQGVAIAPGVSRSGATISAGLWRGLEREEAARFSFLLATPAILGANLLQLWGLSKLSGAGEVASTLLLGFLAAAVSGYLAIRFFLGFLKRRSLYPFSLYCWLLGTL
ncbi:MAG: undecaprenyl-diphosphatase UppP, partial [Anaerolineae bacterium]